MVRTFVDKPAVRDKVPLLIGLAGPSGGGKTFSALRLASGMQRVSGGDVYVVDTESKRALHYADKFKFRHLEFTAPFGPLDYLAAVDHCHKKGAGVIVIDSMSHEHEGPGGLLEVHAAETERLAKLWGVSPSKSQMAAWSKPKSERRRLINSLLQIPCNFIFCFRAKEKMKVERGKDPEKLGFMPIAGEEFVFEMTVNALLLPAAGGKPTWNPHEAGEKLMVKMPEQFRDLLLKHPGPLDEGLGEEMARWAAGANTGAPPPLVNLLEARVRECKTKGEVEGMRAVLTARKAELNVKDQRHLGKVLNEALAVLPDAAPVDEPVEDDGYAGDHTLPGMAGANELAQAH